MFFQKISGIFKSEMNPCNGKEICPKLKIKRCVVMRTKSGLEKDRDIFLKTALKGRQYKKSSLTREGSARRYFRIWADSSSLKMKSVLTKKELSKKPKTTSWVLAHSPLEQQKAFLLKGSVFFRAGMSVPKVKARDSQKGFLLLEDLGNQSLEKEVRKKKALPFSYYKRALDQIVKLQRQSRLFDGERFFTKADFFEEMLWTEKYLIKDFCKLQPKKKLQAGYRREWDSICKTLASFPFRPAHRDYHSKNLFIKNEKLYVIDFQDAGFFPRFYDAVSLLYDVYVDCGMKSADREKLFLYFVLESFFSEKEMTEELRKEIFITALQRLFKACGRFAGFYCLKGQKTHLKYISPALKMIEQLLREQKKPYPFFLELIQKIKV